MRHSQTEQLERDTAETKPCCLAMVLTCKPVCLITRILSSMPEKMGQIQLYNQQLKKLTFYERESYHFHIHHNPVWRQVYDIKIEKSWNSSHNHCMIFQHRPKKTYHNPIVEYFESKVSRLRLYKMRVLMYYVENKARLDTWKWGERKWRIIF